jgi:hypothetical protein
MDLAHWEFLLLLAGFALGVFALARPDMNRWLRNGLMLIGWGTFLTCGVLFVVFSGAVFQWPIVGVQSPILFPEPSSLTSPRPQLDMQALNGDWVHITLGSMEFGSRVFGQRGTQENAINGMGFNSFFPIRIYLEKSRIFLDATLYGGHPNYPPIVITHNDFAHDALLYQMTWDWNRNSRALEIVDEKKEPIFQLIYDPPDHVIVSGVFVLPGSELVITDCGKGLPPRFQNLPPPSLWSPPPPSPTLRCQRVFKYPGWKYPGQLE